MATLTSIRNGIGTNLGNISSLSVYNYVPDSIEPPTAIVGVVQTLEYDTSMARGADTYTIPVLLYVSRVDAQDSQETLDAYLASSGASSVKAQIESDQTLDSSAQSCRVVEANNYGVYTVNNIDYLGVEFEVEVIA
jgi:hypothetical protein|tara:strand:+ start:9219 stop:9626 length:408 start_codon:yes stop_codon:yes gene_type:complete